jgi:hypothetical protein
MLRYAASLKGQAHDLRKSLTESETVRYKVMNTNTKEINKGGLL